MKKCDVLLPAGLGAQRSHADIAFTHLSKNGFFAPATRCPDKCELHSSKA